MASCTPVVPVVPLDNASVDMQLLSSSSSRCEMQSLPPVPVGDGHATERLAGDAKLMLAGRLRAMVDCARAGDAPTAFVRMRGHIGSLLTKHTLICRGCCCLGCPCLLLDPRLLPVFCCCGCCRGWCSTLCGHGDQVRTVHC